MIGVLEVFDRFPREFFFGVLEIFDGCPGDIWLVSWRY